MNTFWQIRQKRPHQARILRDGSRTTLGSREYLIKFWSCQVISNLSHSVEASLELFVELLTHRPQKETSLIFGRVTRIDSDNDFFISTFLYQRLCFWKRNLVSDAIATTIFFAGHSKRRGLHWKEWPQCDFYLLWTNIKPGQDTYKPLSNG